MLRPKNSIISALLAAALITACASGCSVKKIDKNDTNQAKTESTSGSQTETAKPETEQSESVTSETEQSETEQTESATSETEQTGSVSFETEQNESVTSEPEQTETETAITEDTEPAASETEQTEPATSENDQGDTETSDTELTDAETSDTDTSETETSDSGSSDTEQTADPVMNGKTVNGFDIVTENGMTYIDGVLIANKSYPLPSWYDPGDLTSETYAAFYAMQAAASAEGLFLYSCSGYRSYDTQNWLYWSYVNRDGQTLADTYSARPGHSEHQTGMAIDVNNTLASFAYSAEGIWLAEHCWEYGFIIRYPQGKESITGYMYEPWHVRYVGTELALTLRDNGLTLEEYFGIDSVYR